MEFLRHLSEVVMPLPHQGGVQSWILVITELHRYQGVGYKSDIVVISGDHDNALGTRSLLPTQLQS